MQQGRYAAKVVRARLRGRARRRRSATATRATSRRSAAAPRSPTSKGCKLSGFVAWLTWLVVHLWYLVGFQNRLLVFIRWTFSFVTHGRGARLITGPPLKGDRPPSD